MSVRVYFNNVSKERNSTLRASFSRGYDCTLKQNTSLDRPTFLVSASDMNYNVAKWGDRFYFVNDVVSVNNNLWEVSCTLDVLATYKNEILASNQLVVRCESDPDYALIDDVCNTQMTPNVISPIEDTNIPFSVDNATVVITVKGQKGSVFYAMAWGSFENLCKALYSSTQDDVWTALTLPNSFTMTYLDPIDYITDVKLIPINFTNISGTNSTKISLGYWEYEDPDQTAVFRILSSRVLYEKNDISISLTALETGDRAFLNSNKFRHVSISLPGAECLPLDADILTSGNTVKIKVAIDVAGSIAYRIEYGSGHVIFSSGIIGTSIAIHSNVPNVAGAIGGISQVISSAATGATVGSGINPGVGTVAGAIIGGAIAIPSAIQNAGPLGITETKGSDGSIAGMMINTKIVINETRYSISGRGPITNGYPCMKFLNLGTLRGYCQCLNAHIAAAAQIEELEALDNFVNTGFFIE